MSDPRRDVPRTDVLLADPRLRAASLHLGTATVREVVRQVQEQVRAGEVDPDRAADRAAAALPTAATSLREVLNATGVVVHTNLGRAPLSTAAIAALSRAAGSTDLEYDVATGSRGARGRGTTQALLDAVPDAQAALVVNNGAAAVLLAITALAGPGREVVVSRGELVEIGDGFRLPELLTSTGSVLREVGTTNRTHASDYAAAIGASTGCLLKVHPSNFAVTGFTSAPSVTELAALGATRPGDEPGPPVVVDTGSGLLSSDPLLPDEPDAGTALRAGADLVTCSADKLLGGPQAGLVLGRADLVDRLRRHPLARAVRADKLALAALEATLRGPVTPVSAALHADPVDLERRCRQLAEVVGGRVVPHDGAVGGGGAPGVALPGWAVALPADLAEPLRRGEPAVVGRVSRDRLLLDLRAIGPSDDVRVRDAVLVVLALLGR